LPSTIPSLLRILCVLEGLEGGDDEARGGEGHGAHAEDAGEADLAHPWVLGEDEGAEADGRGSGGEGEGALDEAQGEAQGARAEGAVGVEEVEGVVDADAEQGGEHDDVEHIEGDAEGAHQGDEQQQADGQGGERASDRAGAAQVPSEQRQDGGADR
jgi:hypothetical protein